MSNLTKVYLNFEKTSDCEIPMRVDNRIIESNVLSCNRKKTIRISIATHIKRRSYFQYLQL